MIFQRCFYQETTGPLVLTKSTSHSKSLTEDNGHVSRGVLELISQKQVVFHVVFIWRPTGIPTVPVSTH